MDSRGAVAAEAEALAGLGEDLEGVERWLAAEFAGGPAPLAPLLAHAARFRGKRVRAAQVFLVAKACGRTTAEHAALAGIIEMIHAATLAHDDVLDDALQRRGQDCLHVAWDRTSAVLLGDWIYARAFARCTALEDRTASRVLADATARICAGEIHQNLTRGRFDLEEPVYLAQVDGKTAALFEAAGRLAAHAAGVPARIVEAAARHGRLAGRAFQFADDLLDLEGDAGTAGKSLGTDWERGKMTLPLIRMRERAGPSARARLARAFAERAPRVVLREGELAPLFEEAAAACRAETEALLGQACAAAAELPAPAGREALVRLTRWLGHRER